MSDIITYDELENKLAFFNKMYDIVRLVDPVNKKILEYRSTSSVKNNEFCYAYWSNNKICDNCISIRAHLENKCYQKLEQSSDAIMMVTAFPVENSDKPIVLELLKNATETMMIGTGTYSEGRLLYNFVSELNDLAIKDDLTGIYNRRFVNERLPADIVRATLKKMPLSIAFLDIDNFKEVNDTYGHILGDEVIAKVSNILMNCIGSDSDWVARYGGDEFIICFNDTTGIEAHRIAETIRRRISELKVSPKENISITVSLGVYTMEDSALTAEELISLADKRMYEAKQKGRNRTIMTMNNSDTSQL
ncbi:MAG: hypothetical protein K0S61_662 [Anaerocolumna sp.]|jgi:diguanylate cyclase (GGDEF)-like protein|nr:hypothetical protein [Anaerocolumna sp.]